MHTPHIPACHSHVQTETQSSWAFSGPFQVAAPQVRPARGAPCARRAKGDRDLRRGFVDQLRPDLQADTCRERAGAGGVRSKGRCLCQPPAAGGQQPGRVSAGRAGTRTRRMHAEKDAGGGRQGAVKIAGRSGVSSAVAVTLHWTHLRTGVDWKDAEDGEDRALKSRGHVSKTAPSARHEARSAPFAYELRPLLCVADSDDSQLTCPRALRAWWRLV